MSVVVDEARRLLRSLQRRSAVTVLGVVVTALGTGVSAPLALYLDQGLARRSPLAELRGIGVVRLLNANEQEERLDLRQVEALRESMGEAGNLAGFVKPGERPNSSEPARQCAIESRALGLLGVKPELGRLYSASDERSGERIAVISYPLWRSRYAGLPSVLGQTVQSGPAAGRRIIGVMPRGFRFPAPSAQVWVPLSPAGTTSAKGLSGNK